jgi:hypothetical protein
VGGEIIRALSKPVVVGCDPKHHRANCWIVSFFGQRPHFFGSHAPVRWGFEEIIRVGAALASQNGLPKFTKKSLYHALFGIATRQTLTRRENPREAFTAPREPPPALGSRRNRRPGTPEIELCDGCMVEPYPDRTIRARSGSTATEPRGKVAARAAKACGVIVILTMPAI